jgi:RimJ/RimL family protein N-acetyltransferase
MNLYLSKIEKEDMKYLYGWFSNPEFLKFYDYMPPVPQSREEVDKAFAEYEASDYSMIFAVKLSCSSRIIGVVGFEDIIRENGVATAFIGIGDKESRGMGFGEEAWGLLLRYGFEKMDLHRIQLNVLEFNKAAINLYEKSGFRREGTWREFVLRDGKRYDLLLYGLLKNEWEENKRRTIE